MLGFVLGNHCGPRWPRPCRPPFFHRLVRALSRFVCPAWPRCGFFLLHSLVQFVFLWQRVPILSFLSTCCSQKTGGCRNITTDVSTNIGTQELTQQIQLRLFGVYAGRIYFLACFSVKYQMVLVTFFFKHCRY